MAKRAKSSRRSRQPAQRQTNWLLIGGVVAAGVIGLFILLALTTRESEPFSLTQYCEENPDRCMISGAADAPVTMVEISDYNCPACRIFHEQTAEQIMSAYVQTGQLRWIVLPFALRDETAPAAEAAFCAGEQDRFFDFHEALFDLQGTQVGLTRAGFLQTAAQVGLDTELYGRCLDDRAYRDTVQANIRAAQSAGVRATPSFLINGFKIEGAQPFPVFQQRITTLLQS